MLGFAAKYFYGSRKRAFKILRDSSVPPEKKHGINIKPLLLKFAKKQKFNEDFLDRFHLDLLDDKKRSEEFEELYDTCAYRYDTRFYFVLRYLGANNKSTGICLLGFEIKNNKILIKQIQGIRFDSWEYSPQKQEEIKEALSFLRWEKFLVRACEIWAAKLGFKKIGILKAENNFYFFRASSDDQLSESEKAKNSRLLMRYNVTAKRMGYKLKPESEYFMKLLKKHPELKGVF